MYMYVFSMTRALSCIVYIHIHPHEGGYIISVIHLKTTCITEIYQLFAVLLAFLLHVEELLSLNQIDFSQLEALCSSSPQPS